MIGDTVAIRPDFELNDPLDAAEHLLAWIIETGLTAFQSEAAHAKEVRRAATRVWNLDAINLVPLMMDMSFMFAPMLGLEDSAQVERSRPSIDPSDGVWDVRVRALRKRIVRAVGRVHDRVAHNGAAAHQGPGGRIGRLIGAIIERALRQHALPTVAGMPSFRVTAGFARQFQAMSAPSRKGSGIYPFFVVDARREGAVEWVIASGQVGRNGPFYGVKLNPRLGCHPLRSEPVSLFTHCARNGIPITTHASQCRFPDWLMACADFGTRRATSEAWGSSIAGQRLEQMAFRVPREFLCL